MDDKVLPAKKARVDMLAGKAADVYVILKKDKKQFTTLRKTMIFVGFTEQETQNRALQQRIRRLCRKMQPKDCPPSEIEATAASSSSVFSDLDAKRATADANMNSDGWTLPATEKEAARQLEDFLYTSRWPRREEGILLVRRAFEIFQAYPQLTKHAYYFEWKPKNCKFEDPWLTPLCHFLYTENANLEMIQKVYELNPEVVKHNPPHPFFGDEERFRGLTPLHIACSFHAQEHILRFLVEKHPEARSIQDKNGYLPIDLYIKTLCFSEVYESMYPELLEVCNLLLPPGTSYEPVEFNYGYKGYGRLQESALIVAIEANARPVIKFLVSRIPDKCWDCPFTYKASSRSNFDLHIAHELDLILPKLKDFKCLGHCYDNEAIVHMLESLGSNTSIESLEIELPGELTAECLNSLENFVAKNNTMKSVTFARDPCSAQQDVNYLDALRRGRSRNQSIQVLRLCNFFKQFGCIDVTI